MDRFKFRVLDKKKKKFICFSESLKGNIYEDEKLLEEQNDR